MEEVRLYEAWDAIRLHKKFLTRVRQQTELKQDDDLYPELMRLVLKDFHVHGLRDHICPTMRIAPINKRSQSYELSLTLSYPYPYGCRLQGDRVLLIRKKHNVDLFISFDLEEFAKYLLLTGAEYIERNELICIMNGYSLSLMDKIRSENPQRFLTKRDFTINSSADNEEVRVRMAEILSRYMSIVTKERCHKGMLAGSKPVKIIEKMYGMPARDRQVAPHRQKYYD